MTAARGFHLVLVNKWYGAGHPFSEVIDTLLWGLGELGFSASAGVNRWRYDRRQIVFCPHLLDDATLASLPPDTIAYNFEQIDPASQLPPARLAAFARLCVWDYSRRNIEFWRRAGIAATHLPVGWHPGLERIAAAPQQDVDILFYGIVSERRRAALDRIGAGGLRVAATEALFGAERDQWIARAKAVVNIHHYASGIFEAVRASYLLANGKALISERAADADIPTEYKEAVQWSTYDDLADHCRAVVADADRRRRLEQAGIAAMRSVPLTPLLEQALARSGAGR